MNSYRLFKRTFGVVRWLGVRRGTSNVGVPIPIAHDIGYRETKSPLTQPGHGTASKSPSGNLLGGGFRVNSVLPAAQATATEQER